MKACEFLTETHLDEITRRGMLKGLGGAILGAGLSSENAHARGNWKRIGVNSQGTPMFVDINSIIRNQNGEIECWVKAVAPRSSEEQLLKSTQEHPEFGWERLSTGEVAALHPIIFDVNSRMFKVPRPYGSDNYIRIRPDSMHDTLLDIILNR